MAPKEYWEIPPFEEDDLLWRRIVGHDHEDSEETAAQAAKIFCRAPWGMRLEIGAGVGRLLIPAAEMASYAYGVDSSLSLVARSTHYLRYHEKCRVVLNDGLYLPFRDGYFDFVYSFTCFQHMENLETIQANLREAYRVLRRNGQCRIQTVCGENGTGMHDGYVFRSVDEFGKQFHHAGFMEWEGETDSGWIWVTGIK